MSKQVVDTFKKVVADAPNFCMKEYVERLNEASAPILALLDGTALDRLIGQSSGEETNT